MDNTIDKEDIHKALELVQQIINRMGNNSFLIKGWTVTLVSAILFLQQSVIQILIAVIPVIVFWYLDSYYLRQERLFRKLHDEISKTQDGIIENIFSFNTAKFDNEVDSIIKIAFSKTEILVYITILIILSLGAIIITFYP